MTRAWLIIAAGVLLVLLIWLGIVVAKVNAVPGGAAAYSPARPHAGIEIEMGGCGVEGHADSLEVSGATKGLRETTHLPTETWLAGPDPGRKQETAPNATPCAELPAGIKPGQPPMNIAPAGAKLGLGRVPPVCGPGGLYPGGLIDNRGGLIDNRKEGGCGESCVEPNDETPRADEAPVPVPVLAGGAATGQPPFPSDANAKQAGRAADGEIPSVRPLAVNQSQARLVCLFDAIRQVESGGDDRAVGDEGRSRGPYQCGRAAWADGGGDPKDYDRLVWNRAACERVMLGYWSRYGCRTDEDRAKCWNVGPRWRTRAKIAGEAYWQKVERAMTPLGE